MSAGDPLLDRDRVYDDTLPHSCHGAGGQSVIGKRFPEDPVPLLLDFMRFGGVLAVKPPEMRVASLDNVGLFSAKDFG